MANQLMIPGNVYMGEDALKMAEEELCKFGKKALIVAGKSMVKQGYVEELQQMLENHKIESVLYSEIISEPTDVMVDAGVTLYKESECDFIIGFGGGSPLDAAKAIGAMVTNEGKISDYNGGKEFPNPIPPFVAIPSTAGTGSEVTKFTVISDTTKQIKMLLRGNDLMPKIAIVDPKFTIGTPKNVTAATGLDALTHAVEAYTSKKAFSTTDVFAISAVKRIFQYLPKAYLDGNDKKAREEMSIAAFEAGICINNSSVTIVHGMSRPIGALFHVPHGISNAMLLKECLSFVLDGTYERFAALAVAIGVASHEEENQVAAGRFIKAIEELCSVCEVPTLEQYGIEREEFFKNIDKMAKDAYDSGSPANARKAVTIPDMKQIYCKLWE